ncbi:MAG: hypothetical protein KC535_01840 [Nanoarchaeota archaeon]|nr:hypothetical protein [Nanoarchaeota archaeon]
MSEDISNRTILILVVLTVIVSTLGTLTVLDSANKVNAAPVPVGNTQVSSGQVSLQIASPPPTGQVILQIATQGDSHGSN